MSSHGRAVFQRPSNLFFVDEHHHCDITALVIRGVNPESVCYVMIQMIGNFVVEKAAAAENRKDVV